MFLMVSMPRSTKSCLDVNHGDLMPSWAIFWAMPLPMLPAPMTPILLIR